MKRILISLALTGLLVMFIGTLVFLYKKSQEPPAVFATDSPFVTDIVKKTVATGAIVPRREVALKSRVPGVVDKIHFEEGDLVKIDDLVARIRLIPDMVALNAAEADLQEALINRENAERDLRRHEDLYERQMVSEFEYNRYLLDYKLVNQQLEEAQSNLELIREGAARRTGNVSNEVRSTVTGMVLDIPVKEGTFIIESNTFNEGTTIATVADMTEMVFEGKVDESEVGRIAVGMPLVLSVGALETETFDATLEFISPKGERDQGAVKFDIRAAIKLGKGSFLRAGYSATADIVLQQREDVLAIREGNLIFEQDQTFVEVETGQQVFERRQVQTGLSDGINIEIVSGLSESDTLKKL